MFSLIIKLTNTIQLKYCRKYHYNKHPYSDHSVLVYEMHNNKFNIILPFGNFHIRQVPLTQIQKSSKIL